MQAWTPLGATPPAPFPSSLSKHPLNGSVAPARTLDLPRLEGVAGVVGAIGLPAFAQRALEHVNELVQAASWSVYQVWPTRAPVLYLSAALGVPDTTRDCFQSYVDGLYRRDRSFEAVASLGQAPGHAAVLHLRAEDMPNADHREIIYHRHGVLARMSVAQRQDDGSLLAVNLYRHTHQGLFSGVEIDRFRAAAPVLLAGVTRHIAWGLEREARACAALADSPLREQLRSHCPELTDRELDVCERLLRGMSYDGIAVDLELSVATVKTYRGRAFGRLGLHFKSELFARFLRADGRCQPLG